MTKQNINIHWLASILMIVPTFAVAAPLDLVTGKLPESLPTKSETSVGAENFCTEFQESKSKLIAKVQSKVRGVNDYADNVSENLENERNGRDAKLEESRSEADQTRSAWYAELRERADSDTAEDALKKYVKRLEAAIEDRREAIDSAITEFRSGMDTIVLKRVTAIRLAQSTFQSKVEKAVVVVESDCADGAATATLRRDFKAKLGATRVALVADKKLVATSETEIRTLIDARKQAIDTAQATFRTELAVARAEL